jgi:CTP:molybdopterin cytidylyltransferase MocA
MAPRNKLLELVGGKSIVARVAEAAVASGADPVIVVTGFEAPRIAEA